MLDSKFIQYIGIKDEKIDTVTGVRPMTRWRKGETLEIPLAQANILLQFPDVWREVKEIDGMLVHTVESETGEELRSEVSEEAINEMNEPELRALVKQAGLNIRFKASEEVEQMRDRVLRALEQAV